MLTLERATPTSFTTSTNLAATEGPRPVASAGGAPLERGASSGGGEPLASQAAAKTAVIVPTLPEAGRALATSLSAYATTRNESETWFERCQPRMSALLLGGMM